jgi:hypothetical protein
MTLMKLEQRHVIKFLHAKGLKLEKIASELSNADGADAYAPPTIKYSLHQIKLRKTDIQTYRVSINARS